VYEKATQVSTTKQWSAFVGDKYLVTLRPAEFKIVDDLFRECEISESTRQEYLGHGSGFLLYRILDRALDAYFPVLDKIWSLTENIEDNVFKEEVEVGKDLSILRRDIITQRRVMLPTRTLFVDLEPKLKRFSDIDLTIYFSDLMDHMNKICDSLDELTEVIEVFKDADYLLSSYRANRVIRILAVLFAVALPFLAIFGLYGIYSILYGGIGKASPLTLIVLVVVVLAMVGSLLYFFRRRHLV